MAEPEHTSMHNFAYHPSVASWVQSTALAHLDGASDDVAEQSPDDFYKATPAHTTDLDPSRPATDMATTRQRQQTANGATRSTPKPSVRSVSGSVTSTTSTPRSGPQVPSNRPTVKSLAQKFNQPSSTESSPLSARARTVRPSQTTTSSSPARPAKEASYGTYKFNHLKPRERPQPAPPSPANSRRTNGARASSTPLDQQSTPARRKLSSPTRGTERQLFFGEVVGEHNASSPGFGIPTLESTSHSISSPPAETSTIKMVTEEPQPEHPHPGTLSPIQQLHASGSTFQGVAAGDTAQHSQTSDNRTPRRRSPPSRIPVASRRLSATSDSGSSTRSSKMNGARRPMGGYNKMSPTRPSRVPVGSRGTTSPKRSKAPSQPMLPAVSYRGYRERGKSPHGANSGPSVAAVITAPLAPTSPRLRNSRERQKLQESPGSRPRSADPHASQDYFGNGSTSTTQPQPQMFDAEHVAAELSVKLVDSPTANNDAAFEMNSQLPSTAPDHRRALSLSTAGLHVQPIGQPTSTTTSFEYEESPVLGMPGSFMMTPPIAQNTSPLDVEHKEIQKTQLEPAPSGGELLQARTFQPASKERIPEVPRADDVQEAPSELGFRESIPIMLGSDGPAGWNTASTRPPMHSPRLSIGSQRWRAEPLDATGTISYLEEDDSPIDPFSHRDTLRPDDSASVAFYRQVGQRTPNWAPQVPNVSDAGSFTLDSEAYSVINKVLNMYHESNLITPELAQNSRTQVQSVSPVIAQHKDWGSKEATETYLARLLSDAAGTETREHEAEATTPEQSGYVSKQAVPALSIRDLEADPEEPVTGGTAIIFPSESRRYSRDSRGSNGSTATTIWEGPSRPDSASGYSARDHGHSNGNAAPAQVTYPAPLEWSLPRKAIPNQLPEIAGAGEGLGLSLNDSQQQQQQQQHLPSFQTPQSAPPRPPYSPPPPPTMNSNVSRALSRGRHGYMALSSNDELRVSASLDEHPANGLEMHPQEDPEATPTAALQPERTPELAPTIVTVQEAEPSAEGAPAAATSDQRPQVDETTKMVQKRYRVIEELTKTEHSFCVDMMVAHQIFEGTSREVLTDSERRLLFSNCKDLENFSHGLWKSLKEAIKPIVNQTPPAENSDEAYDEFLCCTTENDRLVKVGSIILASTPRMERVYTTYYLNYGDASDFIKKNANNPELLGWVMACFQHCPNLTSAWDLDSLLIKPVQRMLRYPLLLDDLISKTSPDHPDLPQLKAASDSIKQIASRIEMAKKRQQTLRAATSEGKKEKNKGRLGKTIVKAFISNKDRAKTMQEASQIFEDREYNQVTQKFGGHFFQIQIVIRDFDQYLDAITEQMLQLNSVMLGFITVSETGPSANAEIESTWRRWAMAYIDLQNKVLDEHKTNVRNRVMKPICEVWDQWVSPQKLMEQRKKALLQYAKYKQSVDRKEKVDSKLDEAAKDFITINDSLKQELPRLYELTKNCIRLCEIIFLGIQKDWYKTCSKKILPLLESEPQHTTSINYDFKVYVDRFKSDFRQMEDRARSLAIVNHDLMNNIANFTSPNPTFYSDDASSRKSSSRRTESMGSEMSMLDHRNRNRNSGGYGSTRSGMQSFEGPPRSSPSAPYAGLPTSYPAPTSTPNSAGLIHTRERGATSPYSQASDVTITQRTSGGRPAAPWSSLDGAFDGYDTYAIPASIGASFLNPHPNATSNPSLTPTTTSSSNPGSSRTSGVFNSALPMADLGRASTGEELPPTPNADMDEPEVLFLAASLFEFNIAHDRREGGIPYLVYVPGEIFDVIGMKGELWLARNQDDPSRTVGWIWEKHFARILPEDA